MILGRGSLLDFIYIIYFFFLSHSDFFFVCFILFFFFYWYLLYCPSERNYFCYFFIDFQPTELAFKFFILIINSNSIQRFLYHSAVATSRATHPVWKDRRAIRRDVEALKKKYFVIVSICADSERRSYLRTIIWIRITYIVGLFQVFNLIVCEFYAPL